MGAASQEGLTLELSLHENDDEWQLIRKTYSEAKLFIDAQCQPCQVGLEVDDETTQACLMFIARALSSGDEDARRVWPLSKIMTNCGTNLYHFFRELPVKAMMLQPFLELRGVTWQQLEARNHVKEWQKTLISMTLLFKKYKDMTQRYIPSTTVPRQAVLRLGWFLFLNVKSRLLHDFPDLVSCMTLLVCMINLMLAHATGLPDFIQAQQQAQPGQAVDTLRALCADLKMDVSSVSQQMESINSLLSHLLPFLVPEWRHTSRTRLPATASGPATSRCAFFEGLLSDPTLVKCCIEGLDREYSSLYRKKGEIDEREFLVKDFAAMASPRMSPMSLYNSAKRVHLSGPAPTALAAPPPPATSPGPRPGAALGPGAFVTSGPQRPPGSQAGTPAGLQSPVPIMRLGTSGPNCTPVTEAMEAASWLRATISKSPAEPSLLLQRYLESAGPAVPVTVSRQAQELAEAALPDERAAAAGVTGFPHVQASLNTLRRAEAVRLYFIVLEAVVLGERANGENAMRLLLGAVTFHKGLMACCLEVVIAAFKMVSFNFPHVLHCLKLKAFDLSKVIQPFTRYLPSLPRELKRHLFVIEERILESLAWEPASPLYNLIVQQGGAAGGKGGAAGPAPLLQQEALGPNCVPPSTTTAPDCADAAGCGPATKAQAGPLPLAVGKPVTLGVLREFLGKVMKLMSFRLALMVDSFDFAPFDSWSTFNSILEVLENALYSQTHLFYNRHIDQLVLSALYGYCKVHKLSKVSFKDIIAQYKRQPQATQAVFRSVNLEHSYPGLIPRGQADIIAFYNQCFVPSMKPFLLKISQGHEPAAAASAATANSALSGAAPPLAHLGLPPIPPNPRHGPHVRARRLSSSAVPSAPVPIPNSILSHLPPKPYTFVPQAAAHQDPAREDSAAALPGCTKPRLQASLGSETSLAAPASAPAALDTAALIQTGLRGSRAGEPTAVGGCVAAGAHLHVEQQAAAALSRPARKMPSGIAALLHALDSAEASTHSDQQQQGEELGPAVSSGPCDSGSHSLLSGAGELSGQDGAARRAAHSQPHSPAATQSFPACFAFAPPAGVAAAGSCPGVDVTMAAACKALGAPDIHLLPSSAASPSSDGSSSPRPVCSSGPMLC